MFGKYLRPAPGKSPWDHMRPPRLVAEPRCPECGGTFTIDPRAEVGVTVWHPVPGGMPYVTEERRAAVVAFCNGCEFCIEVTR